MAKLSIVLNNTFETSGMEITNDDTSMTEHLTGRSAIDYFSKADAGKFSIFVMAFIDGVDGAASFEFGPSSVKKGGEFSVAMKDDGSGLIVKAAGTFEVTLRAGVVPVLGTSPSLKIEGLAYLGGNYRGFMSRLSGQTEDNPGGWFVVNDFKIK
jgi:hypothetical protein